MAGTEQSEWGVRAPSRIVAAELLRQATVQAGKSAELPASEFVVKSHIRFPSVSSNDSSSFRTPNVLTAARPQSLQVGGRPTRMSTVSLPPRAAQARTTDALTLSRSARPPRRRRALPRLPPVRSLLTSEAQRLAHEIRTAVADLLDPHEPLAPDGLAARAYAASARGTMCAPPRVRLRARAPALTHARAPRVPAGSASSGGSSSPRPRPYPRCHRSAPRPRRAPTARRRLARGTRARVEWCRACRCSRPSAR